MRDPTSVQYEGINLQAKWSSDSRTVVVMVCFWKRKTALDCLSESAYSVMRHFYIASRMSWYSASSFLRLIWDTELFRFMFLSKNAFSILLEQNVLDNSCLLSKLAELNAKLCLLPLLQLMQSRKFSSGDSNCRDVGSIFCRPLDVFYTFMTYIFWRNSLSFRGRKSDFIW